MKIVIKIISVLAIIVGIMAVVTGSRVLLGVFDPDYKYFTELVSYNVIMGAVSVIAGIFIWQRNSKAIIYSSIIAGLHFLVLLSFITLFSNVISDHSINAMAFRSIAWILFSVIIWKSNLQTTKDETSK